MNPKQQIKVFFFIALPQWWSNLTLFKRLLSGITLLLLIVYIFCLPAKLFHVPYATVVTDRQGELLGARIATDGQWRFPPVEKVPEKLSICLIEFEDRHFYQHWGVNPLAMGRAFLQNFKQKRVVSGGSTLTMQTIRLSRQKNAHSERSSGKAYLLPVWSFAIPKAKSLHCMCHMHLLAEML